MVGDNLNMWTPETLKEVVKLQRKVQWDDFTAETAREALIAFINGGYSATDDRLYAERAVRFARALTEELRKYEDNA